MEGSPSTPGASLPAGTGTVRRIPARCRAENEYLSLGVSPSSSVLPLPLLPRSPSPSSLPFPVLIPSISGGLNLLNSLGRLVRHFTHYHHSLSVPQSLIHQSTSPSSASLRCPSASRQKTNNLDNRLRLVVLVISGGSIFVKTAILRLAHPISSHIDKSGKRIRFLATQPWCDHCSFGSRAWTIVIRASILHPRRCLESFSPKTSCKSHTPGSWITPVVLGYW